MNKLAGLKPSNFIKGKLQHRRFFVNIANFLRTPIFCNICERLLLKISSSSLWKSIPDKCLYLLSFKRSFPLRNAQQNRRTIIWLLFCCNIAIIRIIAKIIYVYRDLKEYVSEKVNVIFLPKEKVKLAIFTWKNLCYTEKKLLKYKVGCFWRFSYVYTVN